MATYAQKQQVLRQEFQLLDVDHNAALSQQEMFQTLDRKLGQQFDRDVANELWTQMDANRDQSVTVDEFISVLIKAEETLKCKVQNTRAVLESNFQQRRDTESKLDQLRQTESYNNFHVMEGSQLYVNVLAGANLKVGYKSNNAQPYVLIRVDKYEKQTTLANGLNPTWQNQQFYFPIVTGKEDVKITVLDYDKFTQNAVIARIDLSLSNDQLGLKNQQLEDLWLDLYEINGNISGARLHVQLQWIHSKVKYLMDVLNQYKGQIEQQEQELQQYDKDLFLLYQTFNNWRLLNQKGYQMNQPIPIAPITQQQINVIPNISNIQPRTAPFTDQFIESNSTFKAIRMCMIATTVLTILICFDKAQFLDIVIIADFYILYEWNAMNENRIKAIGVLCGLSFKLDLVWLYLVGANILFPHHSDISSVYEASIMRMIAILLILSLILKVFLVILCIKLSNELKEYTNPNKKQVKNKQLIRVELQSTQQQLGESRTYLYNRKPIIIS